MKETAAVWAKLFLILIISANTYCTAPAARGFPATCNLSFLSIVRRVDKNCSENFIDKNNPCIARTPINNNTRIAKPLGLKAFITECKRLGNNSCLSHSECCSGYCYKEPGWELGVCKRIRHFEKSNESKDSRNTDTLHNGIDEIFEKGLCAYYAGEEITANGDVFDENEMTAAHRTLPFNTMVKVETMGSSVVVKINDRKTASDGPVLLLSRAAAENMNMDEDTGSVPCQLKLTKVACTPNLGNTCVSHYECCSQYCFKEMFSEAGFCAPK